MSQEAGQPFRRLLLNGCRAFKENAFLLDTYFCARKTTVVTTMAITAMAAANPSLPPTSLMNSV